jgi:segregation and condensation protein B
LEIKELQATIEAVLFACGEPVTADRIAEVLGIDKATVGKLLEQLAEQYEESGRGVCLLRMDGSYQMCTKPQYGDAVRRTMDLRRNTPLSQAAMEVLAIVAYNQPVTKAFVEQVRGVDCSGVLASLTAKGLVEEKGRLELPGRPLLYGTTATFLRCFGISSLDELPPLPQKEPAGEETEDAP